MTKTYNLNGYIFSKLNLVFVVFLTFLLANCASTGKLKNDRPDWIDNTYENCKEGYICAVGEGLTMNDSISSARNEIAKQFSVSIKSNFNSSIFQRDEFIEKSAKSSVNEKVDDVIEGIEIENKYKDNNDKYYALAVLNKNKLADSIKKEIEKIDEQLKELILERPVKYKTAERLINTRNDKEKRYYFLTGNKIVEKITKKNFVDAKSQPTKYKLEITDDDNFGLKNVIVDQIVDNRDKVDNNASKTISAKISFEKSYLRVAGFEKYLVNVNIKCKQGKDILGQLDIHIYETGRNKQQVIDKIKDGIIEQISNSRDKFLV